MSKSLSKLKKEELIIKMQGTEECPKLKHIREDILGISTAAELAEILDITRQTMSRIENCINKLSGAQYLAICALIEERKNIVLQKLEMDESTDVNKVVGYLLKIADFYDAEFTLNTYRLYQKENDIRKKAIYLLRLNTCFRNWKASIKYKEIISKDEEINLIKDSYIGVYINSFDDIDITTKLLNKYKEIKEPKRGIIAFEYSNIINALKNIQNNIDSSDKFNVWAMDFVYNLSLLKREDRIRLFDTNRKIFPSDTKIENVRKWIYITQDDELAEKIKEGIIYAGYINDNDKNLMEKALAMFLERVEILKYENNHLKRRYFNLMEIKRNVQNNIEKEGEYGFKDFIDKEKKKLKKMNDIIISNDDMEQKKEKALHLISKDEFKIAMEKDMDNELDILLQKCLQYLSPKKTT